MPESEIWMLKGRENMSRHLDRQGELDLAAGSIMSYM
jgi:hypothetical protein